MAENDIVIIEDEDDIGTVPAAESTATLTINPHKKSRLQSRTAGGKRSPLWAYFSPNPDISKKD